MARGKGKEPTKRRTAYELLGERVPRSRRGVDPLDDILFDEERELAREHKRLRLEQIVEKRRREVEKMREGIVDSGTLPSNADFLNMAKFMADLSPEEAQRVRSSYTFFKLAEKGGGGGMSLLPMLLNYAKSNPGASENQMINYLKLMDSQLMKGLEIAKAMNPKPAKSEANEMVNYLKLMDSQLMKGLEIAKTVNPNPAKAEANAMEFLKMMKELIIEGVRNPVLQAIKENQPTPGVFEQILTNPALFSRAKDIGMFGGSGGDAAKGSIDLEIEKLRSERELGIKKLDLEWRKSMLEREANDKRTDAVVAALGPLSALFAGPVSQKMRQFGQQQAAAHNPTVTPTTVKQPPANTVVIECPCGHKGTMIFPGSIPDIINCPKCGQELVLGGVPGAGNPEATDTRTGD